MEIKVLILCAQALLIQSISAIYYNGAYNRLAAPWNAFSPYAAAPYAVPRNAPAPWRPTNNPAALSASNCAGVVVRSASPFAPVGVSVVSENAIEGILAVAGELPFLGSVALEGVLPTAGAGDIAYGCGNGEVAMLAEEAAPLGFNTPYVTAGGRNISKLEIFKAGDIVCGFANSEVVMIADEDTPWGFNAPYDNSCRYVPMKDDYV